MLPLVTSTARASNVSSSLPMCILRRMRRLNPPINAVSMRGMLAGIPRAFTFRLDACAVDQKTEPTGAAAIRQAHIQCLLAATWCAVIRPQSNPAQPAAGGSGRNSVVCLQSFANLRHLPSHAKVYSTTYLRGGTSNPSTVSERFTI